MVIFFSIKDPARFLLGYYLFVWAAIYFLSILLFFSISEIFILLNVIIIKIIFLKFLYLNFKNVHKKFNSLLLN